MPRYSTLLFDADNTLFDFSLAEREAICDTLRLIGVTPSEALITSYSDINDSIWKRLECGEITKEALRVVRFAEFCALHEFVTDVPKMALAYTDFLSQKSFLIDGARDVVATLADAHRLYIVTNGIKAVQRARLAASPIGKYFADVFISEEIGFEKPHVGYFREVARRIPQFDARDTLLVGDSLSSDMRGGIATGLDTCWFNPKGAPNKEALPITYTIAALEELLPLLQS